MKVEKESKRQIRNLLTLGFSAVFAALLFAIATLYYYEPGRSYVVRKILLAPDVLEKSTYRQRNRETGREEIYTFSRIRTSEGSSLPLDQYRTLYQKIKDDRSLEPNSNDVVDRFFMESPFTLAILFHEDRGPSDEQIFQEVQFESSGNYYRISLHQSAGQIEWVYFYHPGVR